MITATDMLRELVEACDERARTMDALHEARRSAGGVPLPYGHPHVAAVRDATARQSRAMARARKFLS